MADELKRTPLHSEHVAAGAKLVPFAGYEMPVQYGTGIIAEHQAVRPRAGLFDVSHMGEIELRGPQALDLVQYVTTNDAAKLVVGQAQYSVICREDGGCIDDCIVYRFDDHYMIVVNASNRDKDRDWIMHHSDRFDVEVEDKSDETALIALQGPRAQTILSGLTELPLDDIKYYHFDTGQVDGVDAVISRTGYTGEDGFEVFVETDRTGEVWDALLQGIPAYRDAVAELYDRHASRVMGLAVRIVRNSSDAEDVVQEVFSQAWRTAPNYQPGRGTVVGWLLMMARTRALDRLRIDLAHLEPWKGSDDRYTAD